MLIVALNNFFYFITYFLLFQNELSVSLTEDTEETSFSFGLYEEEVDEEEKEATDSQQ